MIVLDLKGLYTRFLENHGDLLHFSAHSHHFWPDVTREAHLEYWDDCSMTSDRKWEKVFSEIIPTTQYHIARLLNLKDSEQIVFAPNTHELTTRLLSLFLGKPSLKILTSTSEFHSWRRQLKRIMELPQVQVTSLSGDLLNSRREFIENLKTELQKKPDLFFISQVFFDSGLALSDKELLELCDATPPETIMVVDGYHGFAALPSDLSRLEGKIFYLAGGYKYAQAGEGVGFMVIPKGEWRPAFTGWFAEFAELSTPPGTNVGYANNWMAFMGATQDPSGMYRFNSVWGHFEANGLKVSLIHEHVKTLQLTFLRQLPPSFYQKWKLTPLFNKDLEWHGHFLTFEAPDAEVAENCQKALEMASILIDRRGERLRFGFGLYHDLDDVSELLKRLEILAK